MKKILNHPLMMTPTKSSNKSRVFHKRVLWTNLLAIRAHRGFDFVKKEESGNSKAVSSNILNFSGRYAGKKSIWQDFNGNWEAYLRASESI